MFCVSCGGGVDVACWLVADGGAVVCVPGVREGGEPMTAQPNDRQGWTRGEWHEAARILHKANPDWPCSRIAEALGVSASSVYKVLHPEKAREYARRHEARPERKAAKRAWDREWMMRPEVRGECANPCCPNLRGAAAAVKRPGGHCQSCYLAIADVRRTLAEGMWADGWSLKEMAALYGVTPGYFGVRRANDGWDLPQRVRTGWGTWGLAT